MRNRLAVALAAAFLATSAGAADPAAGKKGTPTMKRVGVGQATAKEIEKVRAKVVAVDANARMITLQGPSGRTETFKVSPEVKRLAEIQAGDDVVMTYERSLFLQYQKPGEKDVETTAYATGERNTAAEAPGGAAAMQLRTTMKVAAVDPKARVVVLQGDMGNLHLVKAGPDIKLQKLKAGDKLFAVYTESLAVDVEKAKAAPADTKQ